MKQVKVLASALALSVVFFGCSTPVSNSSPTTTEPATTTTEPATEKPKGDATAATLDATGGTVPTTETAATKLYAEATAALNKMVTGKMSAAKSNVVSGSRVTAESPKPTAINFSYTDEKGGTVAYTGTSYANYNMPTAATTFTANTTYAKYFDIAVKGSIKGVIKSVTVTTAEYTYTISGTMDNDIDEGISLSMTTDKDAKPSTYSLDFALKLGVVSKLSIKRSDGLGAKYVISYAADYSKTGASVTDQSAIGTAMSDYLGKQPATLTVYNDSNEVVYTATLTGTDAYSSSIFSQTSDTGKTGK